jgi:hypothetical protein
MIRCAAAETGITEVLNGMFVFETTDQFSGSSIRISVFP